MMKEEYYREEIIKMIKEIHNSDYLCSIYYFIRVPYRKDKEAKQNKRE